MKALVVTGQNNYNWEGSSRALKNILEKSGLFTVTINVSPKRGDDMSAFIIDFNPYDVVVLDYNGEDWPAETRNNFVSYVTNGGGVVVYHTANNAFPDWHEYNEITGLGGWNGRDEESGPDIYIQKGQVVRDNSPGKAGSLSPRQEFLVQSFKSRHPILKGLPEKWMHASDLLLSELRGPAKNLEVLAYAYIDPKSNGKRRNEPVLMTIKYGKGRVFHTVLGHAAKEERWFPAMECAGFVTTLQRGAEWAATGKVTLKVPETFPTDTQSLQWWFFEDIYSDIKPVVKRMKEYEIGKSNDCFNILKKLITENIDDQEQMNEYHQIIRQLLKPGESTDECKRILCTDFSWIADDSYREIYVKLNQNPELADKAQYALDMIGN